VAGFFKQTLICLLSTFKVWHDNFFCFIKREKNDLDKRCMHLTLSNKGKSAIPVIEDILSGWAKQCLKGIKEKDLKQALDVLDIMFSNSSKLI